jgi:Xaa-Pro aminopeptidase
LSNRRSRQPAMTIVRRLQSCRERIQHKHLDGYLVSSPVDQFYLTQFDGEDGAAIVLPGGVCLLTDGRFAEEAGRTAPWAQTVVRRGPLKDAIAQVARRHRLRRLGFQPEHLAVSAYTDLQKTIRPTRLVPLAGVVGELRLRKDPSEVHQIEQAVRVAEDAFRNVIRRIRIGMSEQDLAADLQHEMLRLGASAASFPIIVAEGPNSSLPHAKPGERRLGVGSPVLIDWGATVGHYCSDLTRVVFIRKIPPRFRRMYESVLRAQTEAIRAIRPGVRMCDVDGAARKCLVDMGLGRRFAHGLGHGLGLAVHEGPRLAPKVTAPLEPDMVVTVEPGVYIPGVGGVRIEDDVLVTRDGARVLSSLPKDLDAMVVQAGRRSS